MIQKPKGTFDILPNESKKRDYVLNIIKKICNKFDFKEITTPIFEYSELFFRSVGETSDIVNKETYTFTDRGDRSITLRPEGTAGVVRSYIENKLYANNEVSKLFYYGPIFRYERPQKGRYRQFNQFGVEAINSFDPLLDVEVINLLYNILKELGLKEILVRINTIGDIESRIEYKKQLKEYLKNDINNFCNDCKKRYELNPLRILDCKIDKNKLLNPPKIKDYLNKESQEHFKKVLEYLDTLNIKYVIDDKLVRGLDYYTHTVFEIESKIEGFGSNNVIAAGGRYNNLIKELQGPEVGSVGFAFGMERLLEAMECENLFNIPLDYLDFFIVSFNEKNETIKLLNYLRNNNLKGDIDYQNRSFKSQLKLADQLKSKYIIIYGENEIKNKKVQIKNTETKNQEEIDINNLVSYIKGE